jgi:hypothetical protein
MIVLVLLVSIDRVTRASTQPLVEDPGSQLESETAPQNQGRARMTPKSLRVSAAQSEVVPLPTRKPQPTARKRWLNKKGARPKPMP